MTSRTIAIASIDAGDRLRSLDPAWVELLAEEIATDGLIEPIRVAVRGERFRLISGARRLAAHERLGRSEIAAVVEDRAALADDAAVRLAEIKADIVRGDLTVLDRARYLAAWREIHEALHPQPRRGRKPKQAGAEALEEISAQCANIFSDAAKAAFGFSQRSIYLLLKIATITPQAASRIALHPSADRRGDLLLLADQSEAKQLAIADMLTADPVRAASVGEAIMLLGEGAPAAPAPVYARLSERFARLPERDQHAFFAMHQSAIDVWIAQRRRTGKAAA